MRHLPQKRDPLSLRSVRAALRKDPQLAMRYSQTAAELLQHAPSHQLSDVLRQAWLCCSPPSPSKPSPSSPRTALILQLWRLRRERRHYVFTHGPDSAPDWPLQEHLRTTASSLTLLCKQNKQLRIQQLLQGAEEVAHNWLTSVYQVVRKLAPKATPKPIQFRDAAGAPSHHGSGSPDDWGLLHRPL